MAENSAPEKPKKKKQGPVRTGAIIPVIIIFALVYPYTYFFFDNHLKRALEWGGYMAYGGEINIENITTSFWNASLQIDKIELTNLEVPTHNSLEIGQIRTQMLWDALLRGKIVIPEAAIEGIQVGTPRKRPGKIKPPQPDAGPGLIARESQKLKAKALEAAQRNFNDNILGDFAAVLGGGVAVKEQLENIKAQLKGVVKTEELQKTLKEKEVEWKQRISDLPTAKDLKALESRLKNVKTKDFKSPNELQTSLKEIDSVFKELEEKRKFVDKTGKTLDVDLTSFQSEIKLIEKYIREDIEQLEKRLKLPKLDAGNISKSLFMQYLSPLLAKVDEYKQLADRWMPPNLKKGAKKDDENVVQAHPRIEGTTYTFGRQNSYPLFWLKKGVISSQAQNSPFGGNVRGELIDATSNQYVLNRPTLLKFAGDFPQKNIQRVSGDFVLDLREHTAATFDLGIASYPIDGKTLANSKDVKLAFANAIGGMRFKGGYHSKEGLSLGLSSVFRSVQWQVESAQSEIQDILTRVLNGIPEVTLQASGKGVFPKIDLDVRSNLGSELVKGFQAALSAKLKEAQAQIEAKVRGLIEVEKQKLMTQYEAIKNQAEGEIKKIQEQVASLKKQADAEKKKAENQANAKLKAEKKKADDLLKKEGKKAADKLKKGLGL